MPQPGQPGLRPKARRDYRARARNLRAIGFTSYAEYLNSDLWRSIRAGILARDGYRCRSCKVARATQVHHASYGVCVLRGDRPGRLFAVCGDCHKAGEFDDHGKTDVRDASRRMGVMSKPAKKKNRKARTPRPKSNPDWEWYLSLVRGTPPR